MIEAIRLVESDAARPLELKEMAAVAGMSKYHFLRVFRRLTGMTPHQYLISARLRRAALALASSRRPVIAVALDAGFGDLSTFNKTLSRRVRPDADAISGLAALGSKTHSQNSAAVSLPVTVAQRCLVELAGGQAREIVLEVDRPRAFHVGEMLAAEGDQFRLGLRPRLRFGHELNHGLDLLAHLFVGRAEHRRIAHLGMRDEQVLAFLRIDVDPA